LNPLSVKTIIEVMIDITIGIISIPVGGRKWPIITLNNNIPVKTINSAMGVNFMYL